MRIKTGDLVVLPPKTQPAISIGEIAGGYHFDPDGPNPYYHWHPVKWIGGAIPRSHFSQDLLCTFGAFLTICRIKRNNAEARILAMRANAWKPEAVKTIKAAPYTSDTDEAASSTDLEDLARDQIAQAISVKFDGHGLTRLVDAILKAQGYTTYQSPDAADGGVAILTGAGPLGFGTPLPDGVRSHNGRS